MTGLKSLLVEHLHVDLALRGPGRRGVGRGLGG